MKLFKNQIQVYQKTKYKKETRFGNLKWITFSVVCLRVGVINRRML